MVPRTAEGHGSRVAIVLTQPVTEELDRPSRPALAQRALSCEVFDTFEGLDHLRPQWDEAVLRGEGSVYMTFDWLRVWWHFYGGAASLRLFMFWHGDRLVAVLPLYIDTLGWGLLRCRVARLVGANIPPKVFNPPVPEEHAPAVFVAVLDRLFTHDQCDVLSVGPASELARWRQPLEGLCLQRADLVGEWSALCGTHSVFHLPATMDAYYASLSKNERKHRRKYELRLLAKEHETHVDVVTDRDLVAQELDRFAEQHRQQWFAEGKPGHFGAWPRALAFNKALVDAQARLGRLRFIRILADGEVVANQYVFAFGSAYYWELPSRKVASEWERFSLGPTGIVTMLSRGIDEGMSRVEGGLAHYDYKVRLGAKEYGTHTYRIVAPRRLSSLRTRCLSAVRSCIGLVYHKVWYRRIAPRLPRFFWRPQLRSWLRLDF